MKKNVTIYDIAREAGVSAATVTRVINHSPSVREATRQKVQQVIDARGYTPSVLAQDLGSGSARGGRSPRGPAGRRRSGGRSP